MEERKRIQGFSNYEITTNGDVYSMCRKNNGSSSIDYNEKLLKQTNVIGGYTFVGLTNDKSKRKTVAVHRLVALTFIDKHYSNIPLIVNHKDGNKHNNKVSNLEWCTYSQNSQHACDNGLNPGAKGESNGQSKISEKQARDIISKILNGSTNTEISEEYGLHDRYVSLIRHRRRWKYIWISEFGDTIAPKSAKKISFAEPKARKVSSKEQEYIIKEIINGAELKSLAKKFNLDPSSLSHIKAKRSWKNVWKRMNLI